MTTSPSDLIPVALAFLDSLEAETVLQPYVAAGVRKALGLPPRHWPPQPGDVWSDENPFCPLWFARLVDSSDDAQITMAPLYQAIPAETPEKLLESSCQLALAYRKKGDQ